MSVYACADLHGRYDLYKQICDFLKKDDKVFFLGDACDRGPDGWKLMKSIYNNDRFIYLKGNHEDMFVKATADIEHYGIYESNYFLSIQNGGENTIMEWEKEINRGYWIEKINQLPVIDTYKNKDNIEIYLCHAGFTPSKQGLPNENNLLWDRNHYLNNDWDNKNFNNCIVVHGHTPVPLLKKDLNIPKNDSESFGAFWYCNDHKVCIDNGSVWTNVCCLFDLDTFDEHIFMI